MSGKLFCVRFDSNLFIGLLSGIAMLLLSFGMNCFPGTVFSVLFLRSILMIFVLGFLYPLYMILFRENQSLSVLGIHTIRWKSSLFINILAAFVLWIILSSTTQELQITKESFYAISYIWVAGIFEMIFIFGFLRYKFEQSLGIVPAIIVTSVFYSLHHAGFQPEFIKLFFVGIMYLAVFYITKNILIIFPLFWGVGAIWDVLQNSTAGEQISNAFSFFISICLFVGMIIATSIMYYLINFPKHERTLDQ